MRIVSLLRTTLLLPVVVLFFGAAKAQKGKNGSRTITASGTVVNEYTAITSDINAGDPTIFVVSSSLNTGTAFSAPLASGDLIMIIQHQGALINTTDDSTYGQVVSYENCGNYELCQVAAVPGPTSITLSCGTVHSYSAAGRTQVIRVPRYVRLTVNSGASITGPAWNGSTGGVLVIEADTSVLINAGSSIDISGKGFRGGILSENLSNYGVLNYRGATGDFGAEKGESIAGYQTGYDSSGGRFAKGSPANGGGGGSGHNCGGGGGANGGSASAWNGKGNPDISVPNYVTAWNLESPGFSSNVSSGGGKGGYSFSSVNLDALTIGPFNNGWGGDYRRENGGRGGHPLDYSSGRIFLGGGGGAGDQNDGRGGNGASGGGIVFIISGGDISGTGLISVNGNNGFNSVSSFNANDAAGGAGAGGTVLLKAAGIIGGITIDANGGRGGNQNVGFLQNDAYGPGGGGGGGYVSISGGFPVCNVNGGGNGVTNSAGLQEFPPNGATRGGAGTVDSSVSVFTFSATDDTICAGGTTTLTAFTSGTVPAGTVFGWYTQPFDGSPVATGLTYTTANLSASTTFYFGPCPGHYRIPVRVVVDAVNAYITSPSPTPCAGSPGDFIGNGAAVNGTIGSWTWNFGDGSPAESGQNVTHSFDTAGTYLVVLTATTAFGCQAVAPFTVNILAGPTVSFSALDTAGCAPFTAAFTATATSTGSYTWDFGDGATDTTLTPSHTYLSPGLYTVSFSSATAQCVSRVDLPGYITVNPVPDASVVASTLAGCYPLAVTFNHQQYPSATYRWDFGDGDTSSSALPSHTFVTAGSFAVELITALNGCADTGTVTLTATAPLSVSISTTTVCQGAPSVFNISTSAPFVSAVWDFGDGTSVSVTGGVSHVYQLPGNYNASLVVTDVSGCQGTASQNVLVLPIPFVSFTVQPTSGCDTVAAQFNNQSTGASLYQWSFGDGTSSVQPTPFHLYTAPGNYAVTLVATAANGCSDTLSVPAMVTVYPSPSPSFTASATTICNDTCISFSDGSTGFPITWQWSFPGGSPSSSTSSAPGSICYSQPGTYAVTLITSGAYCSRSVTLNDYIHVSDCSVAPTAAFYCNDSVFCVNGCTSFQSTAQNATQWNWQFTGGTPASSTLPNPQFVCYPASGTYPVTLVVTNPAGSDTLYAAGMVTVDNVPPVPVFTRSGDTLITAVVPGYSYQWYVGGVPIPGANSYRYLALQSANYSVGVTNVSGCRALSQAQYVSLVGIDEAERSLGLEIYPNPFDERLVITTSVSGLTELQLQFIDVTGRTIVTEHIDELKTGRQVSLSTSDISAGTYLVKITCNGRSFVRKLMKF